MTLLRAALASGALLLSALAPTAVAQEPPPSTDPQEPPTKPPVAPEEPPPAPQEPSSALADLLRRLQEERGEPSPVAPGESETTPAPESAPIDPARRLAFLRRASDPVQVALADGIRRDLQFWDASLPLSPGDEVRQGPKGCSILEFEDGAHYRIEGRATWGMASDALANPRRLRIEELARHAELYLGRVELETVVALPGGNELAGRNARVTVRDRDARALEIRNTGPETVVVRSAYLGARILPLAAGQHLFLPVLPEAAAQTPDLTHSAELPAARGGPLVVQAPDPVRLSVGDASIALEGAGPIPGIARACGARLVVRPGESIQLRRAPLGFPRREERSE